MRAVAVIAALVVAVLAIACSSAGPALMNGDSQRSTVTGDACATPQEGCPCSEAGQTVECGTVHHTSGNYVACSMGTRTCDGTQWGACEGDQVTTKYIAGSTLHGLDLGGSTACGSSNPCDPYCQNFVDNGNGVDGGAEFLGGNDGGITLAPGQVETTSNGDTACPGGTNVHQGACNAAPYRTCQQDFHCNASTNACVWNQPSYVDNTCNGVDLTIGAACDDGSNKQNIPLCNRGTGTVAKGTTVGINLLNPAQFTAWNNGTCPNLGAPSCTWTLTAPLGPGQCVDVTSCNRNGVTYAVVNSGTGAIAECAGRCANNGSYVKNNGMLGCNACGTPPVPSGVYTRDYLAVCPSGTHVEWEFFSWQANVPGGTSIAFQAQTATTEAALSGPPVPPYVGAGTASSTTTTWTSDPNTIAWHLANDVTPGLKSQSWLRITMTFHSSGPNAPTLLSWRQAYDCKPSE